MIGVLLFAHGTIAKAFLDAATGILGQLVNVRAVSLPLALDEGEVLEELQEARRSLAQGDGILILTDMFGGTPCNLSLSFLDDDRIEVLTGMNLPMILKILSSREGVELSELARIAKDCGQENICLAREILEQKTSEK